MAVRFDAATDRLTGGGVTGTVATVLCWFRVAVDRNNFTNAWVLWNSGTTGVEAGFGTAADGTSFTLFDSAFTTMAGPNVTVGTWYCMAAVLNGTSWTLYYGTSPTSLTVVGPSTRAAISSPGGLSVSDPADWLNGDIAGFKVYAAALSAGQVATELADDAPISTTNMVRNHSFVTSPGTTNEAGSGGNLTAGSTATATSTGPALFDTNTAVLAGSAPRATGSLAATQADAVQVVETYTDGDTGGATVSYTVPGVAVGDGLLVFLGNAYEPAADLVLVPTASLAGTWTAAGAVLGDADAPNYFNQNLAARLFVPSEAGTCLVSSTEDNENVMAVVHLRAPAGYVPTVEDTSDHSATQSGGGPAAEQIIGPVDAVTGGVLVGCWVGIRFAANSWSTPAGMVEEVDFGDPANTQTMMVATQASTAGTSGTRTSTAALAPSNGYAGKLIAIGYDEAPAANTGVLAGSAPQASGALAATQTDAGALSGVAPSPTGSLVSTTSTAGALAGSSPVPTGSLVATQTTGGALAGTAPVATGALVSTTTNPAALAGQAPRAVADLVEGSVRLATLAGQSPRATGSLAADLRTSGALDGQAPRAVGSIHEALPAPVVDGALRAGTITVADGWSTGTPSKAAGWATSAPTITRGWRAGPPDEED